MFNFMVKSKLISRIHFSFSSKHKVFDKKNNSVLIVEDLQNQLPFMAEVQLSHSSTKGVILKLQDNNRAVLALYQESKSSTDKGNQISISKITNNWKHSLTPFIQKSSNIQSLKHQLLDVNLDQIPQNQQSSAKLSQPYIDQQPLHILNGKKRRLNSSSPIFNICHDLYYGDMISFMGCKGSKKSSNSWNIAKQFISHSHNNLSIYINPNPQQVNSFSQICPHSLCFTIPQHQRPTDAGVYMLTLKAIKLSTQLKKKGLNVLLIVDNLSDIMYREWNLLQSIKFDSKIDDSSKIFQYNTLKIPPVSILNEIYSNCEDNNSNNKAQSKNSVNKNGSLTSILISQKQNSELVQEITSYSNNLKHLQTLSQVIEFPLNFKINTNLYYPRPKSQEDFEAMKQESGFEQREIHRFLRGYVNKYLNEKRETELKRQLYKNDIKQAPWDYFFLLDSEWWVNGVKQVGNSSKSYKQANQFLRWVVFNIQNDYLGHWNVSAVESYRKLVQYLKNQQNLEVGAPVQKVSLSREEMESFVEEAKMEGLMNPFKKDYLI